MAWSFVQNCVLNMWFARPAGVPFHMSVVGPDVSIGAQLLTPIVNPGYPSYGARVAIPASALSGSGQTVSNTIPSQTAGVSQLTYCAFQDSGFGGPGNQLWQVFAVQGASVHYGIDPVFMVPTVDYVFLLLDAPYGIDVNDWN
jgi:hypothetical protein